MPAFSRLRVGEVRPSQVIHTSGIGAIVDLPGFSAMVMGLEEWEPPSPQTEIVEPRLLGLVQSHLGPQVQRLVGPHVAASDGGFDPFDPEWRRGVPVVPFPGWVRCPACNLIAPLNFGVFELKQDTWRPDRTHYVHANCAKTPRPPAVVPVRFVIACERGHLGDFPWKQYVHGGPTNCQALLRFYEFGVSAEAADILVKCDVCGSAKPMSRAFGEDARQTLGQCPGRHPHLRSQSDCAEVPKAMLAGASNLWFAVHAAAISIPSEKGRLVQLVQEKWPELKPITSREILVAFRAAGHLQAFAQWTDDELWNAIDAARKGGGQKAPAKASGLRVEEWDIFSDPDASRNGPDFRLVPEAIPPGYEPFLEKVVLVERLRVVKALLGFTRIVSPGDFADVSEIPEIRRVPIARRPPEWVPAAEVRGEGIFLELREPVLVEWTAKVAVREREFREAHRRFRQARRIEQPDMNFPGIRYVLLHSLAHALVRQFSIECGYGAASLQERVYAREAGPDGPAMAGILLYTAAADSEGTLGGLVSLGRAKRLAYHLDQALEQLRLCASDPLCSEHRPTGHGVTLHGAACHACLFAAETSCERSNKYLDRTLLVRTIGGDPVPLFEAMPIGSGQRRSRG
jgi:hypothetical protein